MSWEMAAFSFSARGAAAVAGAPPPCADVSRRLPGAEWATQPQLAWQLPRPAAPAARPAADPDVAARLAALRGASLPAEALGGAPAAPPPRAAAAPFAPRWRAAAGGARPQSATAAAAAGVAGDPAARAWEWGLPVEGANLWDPEVGALLLKGLAHEGAARCGPEPSAAAAQALLTAHFSLHGAFLLAAPLLEPGALAPLRAAGTPCIAVHGGADLVCPPAAAFELSEAWPEAEVAVVAGAGHSMYDPLITHELVSATDRLRGVPVV
jgi:hypothetical protein